MNRLLHHPYLLLLFLAAYHAQSQEAAEAVYQRYESKFIEEVLQLEFNVEKDMIMLKGYSPVAYVEQGEAVMGNPNISAQYGDVIYQFASLEEKALFMDDPDKYIPAYGGYCAYGVAVAKHLDIDPTNFKIIDGRSYFFLRNERVDALKIWEKSNESKMMTNAQANWEILRLLPDGE